MTANPYQETMNAERDKLEAVRESFKLNELRNSEMKLQGKNAERDKLEAVRESFKLSELQNSEMKLQGKNKREKTKSYNVIHSAVPAASYFTLANASASSSTTSAIQFDAIANMSTSAAASIIDDHPPIFSLPSTTSDQHKTQNNNNNNAARRMSSSQKISSINIKSLQSSESPFEHTPEMARLQEMDFAARLMQLFLKNRMIYKKQVVPAVQAKRFKDEKAMKKFARDPELKSLEDRVELMLQEQHWAAYIVGKAWRRVLSKRRGHETSVVVHFSNNGKSSPQHFENDEDEEFGIYHDDKDGDDSADEDEDERKDRSHAELDSTQRMKQSHDLASRSLLTDKKKTKKKITQSISSNNNNKGFTIGNLLKKRENDQIPLLTNGRDALALAYVLQFAADEDAARKHSSPMAIESFREHSKLTHLAKEKRLQKKMEKQIEASRGPMAAMLHQEQHRNERMGGHASFYGSFAYKNQDTLDVWANYNEKATFRWRFLWGLHALYDSILTHRPGSKIGQLLATGSLVPAWSCTFRECLNIANVSLDGKETEMQRRPPTKAMVCFKKFQQQEEAEQELKEQVEYEKSRERECRSMTTKQRLRDLRRVWIPQNTELLMLLENNNQNENNDPDVDNNDNIFQQQQRQIESSPPQDNSNNNIKHDHNENNLYIMDTPDREKADRHSLPQNNNFISPGGFSSLPDLLGSGGGGSTIATKKSTNQRRQNASPGGQGSETVERMLESEQRKRNFGEHEHSWIEEQRRLEEEYDDDDDEKNNNKLIHPQEHDDEENDSNYENEDDDDDDYCSFSSPTRSIMSQNSPKISSNNNNNKTSKQPLKNNNNNGSSLPPQYHLHLQCDDEDVEEIDFGNGGNHHHHQQEDDGIDWNYYQGQKQQQQQQRQQHQDRKSKHLMLNPQVKLSQHQLRNQEIRKNDLFFKQQQLQQQMLKKILSNKELFLRNDDGDDHDDEYDRQGISRSDTRNEFSRNGNNSRNVSPNAAAANTASLARAEPSSNSLQENNNNRQLPSLVPSSISNDRLILPQNSNATTLPPQQKRVQGPRYASPKAKADLDELLRKKIINPTSLMDALPNGDANVTTKFHICRQELIENLTRIGGLGGGGSNKNSRASTSMSNYGNDTRKKSLAPSLSVATVQRRRKTTTPSPPPAGTSAEQKRKQEESRKKFMALMYHGTEFDPTFEHLPSHHFVAPKVVQPPHGNDNQDSSLTLLVHTGLDDAAAEGNKETAAGVTKKNVIKIKKNVVVVVKSKQKKTKEVEVENEDDANLEEGHSAARLRHKVNQSSPQ